MSRPKGTVPVKLSRGKARSFSRWLASYSLPEPTILGEAGLSDHEKAENRNRQALLIQLLAKSLQPQRTGRRRKPVSTYYLLKEAIGLIESGHAALTMPRNIRPIARQIVRATKRKPGPKLTRNQRKQNLRNGLYAPETERRYRWEEKKRIARKAKLEGQSEAEHSDGALAKPGDDGFPILALIAAKRTLL